MRRARDDLHRQRDQLRLRDVASDRARAFVLLLVLTLGVALLRDLDVEWRIKSILISDSTPARASAVTARRVEVESFASDVRALPRRLQVRPELRGSVIVDAVNTIRKSEIAQASLTPTTSSSARMKRGS